MAGNIDGNERLVSGLFVVNKIAGWGNRLKDLEVRVGSTGVPCGHDAAKLTTNTVAGQFAGPGVDGETYEIKFTSPIRGKFISLQLQVTDYLQIEEVYLPGGKFW